MINNPDFKIASSFTFGISKVELNDAGKIWEKYRAGNGGGLRVLVDKDGKVIALNPSPDEVEEHLRRLLGK